MKSLLSLAIIISLAPIVALGDAQVLPPGVRAFVYRKASATIPGRYDSEGVIGSFAVQKTFDMGMLRQLSTEVAMALDEIKKTDSSLEAGMNVGEINMQPEIKVEGDGFGLAIGMFKNFMLVGSIPYLRSSVHLDGGFNPSTSIHQTAETLESMANEPSRSDSDTLRALAQLMRQLPVLRGEHLQDIMVNEYGYKPIGDWTASGVGDAQVYGQFLANDGSWLKNAVRLGATFPTGRADDPDNILDVAFGRGYLGTWVESVNDVHIFSEDRLIFIANLKYEYGWPTNQTRRLSSNKELPITKEKEEVRFEPGTSWTARGELESRVLWDFRVFSSYSMYYKNQDRFRGGRPDYDYSILASGTEGSSQTAEIGAFYTTADLYVKQKFPIPLKLKGSYSQTMAGNNTEIIDMAYIELQMYF
jgi:hypothetical protein